MSGTATVISSAVHATKHDMAKGSHTTRGGWEPKTCTICHQPVQVTKRPALRFHLDDLTGWALAWHVDCEQPGWPHIRQQHMPGKEDSCSPQSQT